MFAGWYDSFMIVTLTGPTASGKTSIARRLLEEIPDSSMVLSLTTRAPRPTDVPGEYRYVTHEEFENLNKQNLFEWSVPHKDQWYGTLKETLHETISNPNRVWIMILVLDAVATARTFLQKHDALSHHKPFFILVPDDERLARAQKRDGSDAVIKLGNAEINWSAWADETGVPFIRIENKEGELERSVAEIREAIKQ